MRRRIWDKRLEHNGFGYGPLSQNTKNPIVLFEGKGWDLTLRELVFSVLIVGVMVLVGFFISEVIERKVNDSNLRYNQAVALLTDDQFKYALDTDVGHVFANGRLVADSPVKNEHLEGEYLSVYVEHQRYRMHTRRVAYTVTDSRGRSHTKYRTETYWSWDTMRCSSSHSPTVTYCGVRFPYNKFGYSWIGSDATRHSTGFRARDVVTVVPKTFIASVFGEAKSKTLVGDGLTLAPMSIEAYRKDLTTSNALSIFWIIWGIVMVFALVGFYVVENDWLED